MPPSCSLDGCYAQACVKTATRINSETLIEQRCLMGKISIIIISARCDSDAFNNRAIRLLDNEEVLL